MFGGVKSRSRFAGRVAVVVVKLAAVEEDEEIIEIVADVPSYTSYSSFMAGCASSCNFLDKWRAKYWFPHWSDNCFFCRSCIE